MRIKQHTPVSAPSANDEKLSQYGYVEESGWSNGPKFFPWVQSMEARCRVEQTDEFGVARPDRAATRGGFDNPMEAMMMAYALHKGWSEQRAVALIGIIADGPAKKE